ncbi:hypothetical protein HPP92_018637 [Vanilla planifolia]|uniref:Uncharacterized protein n=1 Tax=Vanilla planifolia TaxID=51239 RepID=A0A835QD87_VANPL|nr:hypothetical protein HPP92_018637 [Vanilla planifolia]
MDSGGMVAHEMAEAQEEVVERQAEAPEVVAKRQGGLKEMWCSGKVGSRGGGGSGGGVAAKRAQEEKTEIRATMGLEEGENGD